MVKFAIIIPFRPKAESTDWAKESELLQQTIESVLRQTYSEVKVFVVYTDLPAHTITQQQVEYISFPYGYKTYDEIESREELLQKFKKSAKMVVRRWDKARKLCYGSKLAKEEGFHYIMALDADDLLSKHFLAKLLSASNNGQCPGWYMYKGYIYKPGSGYLLLVSKEMRFLNGSTHVLRSDLVSIPDFNSNIWIDYSLFVDHGWVKDRVKKYLNADLLPITKPMLVYIVHGSNISKVNAKEYGLSFKNIIKHIIRIRFLTKKKREEFQIR